MAARCLPAAGLAVAAALLTTSGSPAAAADALWGLQTTMQSCLETSKADVCRQAEARVNALTRNRAYPQASHLCHEEIAELALVVTLLPKRDAIPTEVMASVGDVQQACMPYGF